MAKEEFTQSILTSVNEDIPFYKKYPTPIIRNNLPTPLLSNESFDTSYRNTLCGIAEQIESDRLYVEKLLKKRSKKKINE